MSLSYSTGLFFLFGLSGTCMYCICGYLALNGTLYLLEEFGPEKGVYIACCLMPVLFSIVVPLRRHLMAFFSCVEVFVVDMQSELGVLVTTKQVKP